MKEYLGIILIMIVSVLWCVWLLVQAVECGNAGGAYIIPGQGGGFPVCVPGMKP